jgi:hypothetical protein
MFFVQTEGKDFTIKLPTLKQRDRTIAEIIVLLLIEEWPLSPKGLFFRVQRLHSKPVSFQAVHKAVKKLHQEQILSKKEKYYCLNPEWLKQISDFGKRMAKNYEQKEVNLKELP